MTDSLANPIAPPAVAANSARPRRKWRWLKLAAAVPILAVIFYFLYQPMRKDIQSLRDNGLSTLHIQWPWVAGSLFFLLCARTTNALNCRQVLAAMGHRLSARQVAPIIWVASLGRYIPGKVLAASAVFMLTRLGLTLAESMAGLGLSMLLMILMSLLVSLPLLFFPPVNQFVHHGLLIAPAALILAAIALHPATFTRLCNILLRLLKRPPLPARLQTAPFARAIAATILRVVFLGTALFCAARAMTHLDPAIYPLAIGTAALLSFSGFVAFPVPAGLGVHEAVIVMMFTPLVPLIGVLAILFRLLNLLADAIMGGIGLAMLPGAMRDRPAKI